MLVRKGETILLVNALGAGVKALEALLPKIRIRLFSEVAGASIFFPPKRKLINLFSNSLGYVFELFQTDLKWDFAGERNDISFVLFSHYN